MAEGKERKGPNFTAATYINSALKKAREVGFAELSIDELVTLADNLDEFTNQFYQYYDTKLEEIIAENEKKTEKIRARLDELKAKKTKNN